jgi:predicted ATPase
MGDVCIEAARRGDDATHFIETHSEHLLLRILKRVRQASAGRIASTDALAVKPDDLAILYFDPQPDGSTKVKRIRVTDDGDFLDRWPRGFFEERGKELFDE